MPVPNGRELRNKILLRPIGIPDHAWEMHDKKSWHFVAVENDVVIGCVVLVPLILRNQNPINANGGREPTRQRESVSYWSTVLLSLLQVQNH
jgi:hypothetical protein